VAVMMARLETTFCCLSVCLSLILSFYMSVCLSVYAVIMKTW